MKYLERPSALVALLLLAFALRVLFLFLAGVNAPPTGDELAYQQIAENLAAGNGFFQDNNPFFPGQVLYAWQAPLYPLSLAALYALTGPNLLLAKLFGILISTATVYLVYDLARVMFRGAAERRIAFVAGLLTAIYPGFLTHAHLLLSETLFIFLMLLAFLLAARGLAEPSKRVWWWLAGAGIAWGLATLTRGITLYFAPLFALWIGWMLWRANTKWGGAVIGALLFLVAALICIAPWSARNYSQFGQMVLLETKGGVNLWLGNNPYTPNDFIRNVWKVGIREPMLDPLPQDELERDRAAYALAMNYIRDHPVTFVARMPVKFADFWGFERNLPDIAQATVRGSGWNSLTKLAADVYATLMSMLVIALGVLGMTLAPNDRWKLLLGGFTLYFLGVHLAIFGDGRFHLPLIPLLALYASWLLVQFRQTTFSRPRIVLAFGCLALLIFVWGREVGTALQILTAG